MYICLVTGISSFSLGIAAVQGASFTTALALLITILQVAVGQVIAAESNPAVTCTVAAATNAGSFNTAMTTPNNTNISAIITAINAAQEVVINTGVITSPYSYQAITAGLQSLEVAVTSWDALIS